MHGWVRVSSSFLCPLGNIGVDDLLSRLMEAAENNKEQLLVEVKEENDRAEREQVKYEQDMAYQLALEADQAKEAAKLQKEMSLAAERKRLESEKAEQDAAREANRLQVALIIANLASDFVNQRLTPELQFISRPNKLFHQNQPMVMA